MTMLFLLLACHSTDPIKLGNDSLDTPDTIPPQTCTLPDRSTAGAEIEVVRAFPALAFRYAVGMFQAPDDPSTWYIIGKQGNLYAFDNDPAVNSYTEVLNIQDRVEGSTSEAGFLGAAFHPQWPDVPELFVSYTTGTSTQLTSRISRIPFVNGAFDPDQEEVLLEIEQPFTNHNGGNILFGPDGYLYAGFGDGGSGGDPYGNGQNTDVLLGKMLRIDVDSGDPYGIPADNPFADGQGGRPEIYAWGMRNPWRWSFDRASGDLWVGDVGQNTWEEVDIVERGGNYGWDTREGAHCYPTDPCETAGLIDPISEYNHNGDSASMVGGYVYRGSAIPDLVGTYLYTDTYTGILYGVSGDLETGAWTTQTLIDGTGLVIVSFAEGLDGELFMQDYLTGAIYSIIAAGEASSDPIPPLLSQTGCFDTAQPWVAAPSLVPYEVNMPLWSDGAEKNRWMALPDQSQVTVNAEGDWDLPIGSVTAKLFKIDDQLVETRLMVHQTDGSWAGYSYAWREDGSDAELLPSSETREISGQNWAFPSRAMCMECHTELSGRSLGLTTAQLNRENAKGFDQLEHFAVLGILPTDQAESTVALPSLDGSASIEEKARAYLDVNCSMCHQPDGLGGGNLDLRWQTPVVDMGLCGLSPERGDLGVDGALLLSPGDAAHSVLSLRMHATDVNRMPPLGTALVDTAGVAAIDAWINSQSACP